MSESMRDPEEENQADISKQDVVNALSFNTWKTCAQVLGDVMNARGCVLQSGDSSYFKFFIQTRLALSILDRRGLVELKYEDELTSTESQWKAETESDDKERKECARRIAFYRLTRTGRKKDPEEESLPEGALAPVAIR
ncbi:MAG: hypothetical protein WC651_02415 [Candidatus Gracilibacteria bacterium]|jgi:hypothetical protein